MIRDGGQIARLNSKYPQNEREIERERERETILKQQAEEGRRPIRNLHSQPLPCDIRAMMVDRRLYLPGRFISDSTLELISIRFDFVC